MTWREHIEEDARKHESYKGMLRGGAPEVRAIRYAVRRMKDDAADDVYRELRADCDPMAMAKAQARLSLLTAFLVNEWPTDPAMTDMERAAVGEPSFSEAWR